MKNNKRAFTLIELIGVIAVLALILLVAVPALTKTLKRNEQKNYDDYIDNLAFVSENYIIQKLKEGVTIDGDYYITLGELIDNGYIANTIVNPDNNHTLSKETRIKVNRNIDESFNFAVQEHYLLPDDYILVEYIESTGTQYINTGVIPNQNTGFDIVYLTKNAIGSSRYGSIMGARKNSMVNELQLTSYGYSHYYGDLRFGASDNNAGMTANVKMHSTLKNKVYTNNNGVTYTLAGEFESPVELTIFALNQNGSRIQYGSLQLYSLKLYSGNDLIRDYVPCYRKIDGVIGLYDLVNATFNTNAGSGTFIKGNNI